MQNDKLIVPRDLTEVRQHGFPYFWYDETYEKTFKTLKKKEPRSVLKDEQTINISGSYTKLASTFFPQMFSTRVDGMKTPLEAWNDDKLLARAIELTHRYFKPANYKALRNQISFVSGTQRVSNFRPDVAKFIYNEYGNKGNVYDFSMGYGGRLVGFLASDCIQYVGVDVNEENFVGYHKIFNTYPNDKKVSFIQSPAEEFKPVILEQHFDLAFSSPPYFNKEQYSEDVNQSYLKYTTVEAWLEGFLRPTIKNIKLMLKDMGKFVINIANIKVKGKPVLLVEFTKKIAEEEGFILEREYFYNLTKILGVKDKFEVGNFKKEPIMVFRKVQK